MVSNLFPRAAAGVVEGEKESKQQPWLSISDGTNFRLQNNMYSTNKPLLYDVGSEIPESLIRTVGCSFGEWLLLTKADNNLPDVLVNLLSKETIELPYLRFTYDFCTLTSHPSHPSCHIVYFIRDKNALIICQPGDKKFTIRKWDYEFFPAQIFAVVAGKLFLDILEDSSFNIMGIIEFKASNYRFEVIEMDMKVRPLCSLHSYFFEYSGELFVVDRICYGMYSSNVTGFEIFKADFLNKKWVAVKNLGRVAIFIDYETALAHCASVESGIRGNSIYFLDMDLANYYIYNLGEGTIRMIPTCIEMDPRECSAALHWVMMHWIMMHCDASFPKLLKGDQESICQDSEKENRSNEVVEEVRVQNSWNLVPQELLNLIQLHLFGRDDAVFRVACKAWQQAFVQHYSIPSLLSLTTLLELCQSFSPLLMSQEDISYASVPIFRFFDPVHRKLHRTGMPELRETDIHYSSDGWLLVSRRSDQSIFFLNPLTQEKIELPRVPLGSRVLTYAYSLSFSSVPTSSDCLVVGISHALMLMYTLKHGEQTWRKQELDEFHTEYQREYGHCPVVLNGLHHFMCENRDVVVFSLEDGVECQFPTKFKRQEFLCVEDFFLEIDGVLTLVSVDRGKISIYKWNDLETDWELIEGGGVDFGGKEMFLSRKGSFMEKMDDVGGMGNTIFVPMIDHDAKEGVFYSLATHRYHTFCSGYSSELPLNVDKFPNGIWVKPDMKIVGEENLKWFMG